MAAPLRLAGLGSGTEGTGLSSSSASWAPGKTTAARSAAEALGTTRSTPIG